MPNYIGHKTYSPSALDDSKQWSLQILLIGSQACGSSIFKLLCNTLQSESKVNVSMSSYRTSNIEHQGYDADMRKQKGGRSCQAVFIRSYACCPGTHISFRPATRIYGSLRWGAYSHAFCVVHLGRSARCGLTNRRDTFNAKIFSTWLLRGPVWTLWRLLGTPCVHVGGGLLNRRGTLGARFPSIWLLWDPAWVLS